MADENVVQSLARVLPTLSAAEARVAELLLADPEGSVELTITELAQQCGVSQATVARFAQSLGYTGYRDFRLDLATSTTREHVRRERFSADGGPIAHDASIGDIISTIGYRDAMTIEETTKKLDPDTVETVAAALARSPRIDIVGSGSSGLVAADLQMKLQRIDLPAHHFADHHLALSSVALQKPGGVAIGISHSGQTREVIDALDIAAQANGTTVCITSDPDSQLAHASDLVLRTRSREDEYRSAAMASRIAQLAVVDILFAALVHRRFPVYSEPLSRTFDAVKQRRVPHVRRRKGQDDDSR
ncbi:MurR/RpiR family transcriptional regulator [Paramicrobacterium agarici]|uniref:RpiR family transcriptional regulator n=1 Tax=Paramicrobacterium agarici TaxID=630514 RepID=A0A2A9DRA5_9MICO|nr:MurR/RpiR family transcriptional regulator [Microbacterium agarici]PFG29228.1 RpiR family transcriptional regulator [Microbacterium agarici]